MGVNPNDPDNNNFILVAFIDSTESGTPHVNDPFNIGSPGGIDVSSGNVTVLDISLIDSGTT